MQLIVNVTQDWGIGNDGRLLVSVSDDLKRFRRLTLGKTVILGRNTLQTFPGGRPLKGRRNLILSRRAGFSVEGAEVFTGLPALLDEVRTLDPNQVMVIGGQSVYRALLDYCDTAFVTKTFLTVPADRFFPDLDRLENWTVEARTPVLEEDGIRYQYLTYRNRTPVPLRRQEATE